MHMQRQLCWIGVLLGVAVLLHSPVVGAVESDPLPVPKGTPRERAVSAYNEGVTLMRDKHYAAAQEQFEQALALDETLAETDRINVNIREILDVATEDWGVVVTLVELKDIQLPESMKRAMARQAEAEREKRAKIIAAEG